MISENFSDSLGKYIRISGDDVDRMSDNILSRNVVRSILPLQIEWVNGSKQYIYETTGYVSLDEYLDNNVGSNFCDVGSGLDNEIEDSYEDNKASGYGRNIAGNSGNKYNINSYSISYENILKLFEGILDMSREVGEYFLGADHVVIDPEYIYVSDDFDVRFVYVSEEEYVLGSQLNKLAERLLRISDDRDSRASGFIYRLHKFSLSSDVTWTKLRSFVAEESSSSTSTSSSSSPIKDTGKRQSKVRFSEKSQSDKSRKLQSTFNIGGRRVSKADGNKYSNKSKIINGLRNTKKIEKPEKSEKTRKANKSEKINNFENLNSVSDEKISLNMYIAPVCVMLLGVLIPTILYNMGVFNEALSGRTDMVMLCGAYIFFIVVAGYGAWRICPRRKPEVIKEYESDMSVCLVPYARGQKIIPITGFPWKVGADRARVDAVVDGIGISEVHAHFRREGDTVYLTDDESAGGTYHNDRRLAPWECVRVDDGDMVAFSDALYAVEIID